jgi:hypothetical protein
VNKVTTSSQRLETDLRLRSLSLTGLARSVLALDGLGVDMNIIRFEAHDFKP